MFTSNGPMQDITTSKIVKYPVDFFMLFSVDPLFNYHNVLSMSLKSVAVKGYLYFFYDILNYILWYINFQFNLIQVSSVGYYVKIKWILLFVILIIKLIKNIVLYKIRVLPPNNRWYNENYITLY